eukprot:CAMPEP_0170070184 /NCGR_PEP_ID=MMETSP0019_2-20121128/8577_1 /TAXON_ID=98059 /ORGANISM="Dinobryon sp., Strain UTEXLB2267" /LENGTH=39 /DNA_ID= /DNA_START= /DNA_END= /DNA_ORIENTATION=
MTLITSIPTIQKEPRIMQRTSTSGTYYLEHIDALESMHQ